MESLDTLSASFARNIRVDCSERTITIYLQSVRFFGDWLDAQDLPRTLESLTKDNIASWLGDLAETKAKGTVRTRYRGMRRFVRWLVDEEEITQDPMSGIKAPDPTSRAVPVLTVDDVTKLLKACTGSSFNARRDEAMVRVLLDCGVRIAELAGITTDDVNFDHEVIHVTGKGRKPRAVPFGPKTSRALDRYIRIRRKHKHQHLPGLWLSQRGSYSVDGVDNLLRSIATRAGVKSLHAHRFRHSLAHEWLDSGGQERDLMRIMGWTSTAMLDRYGASVADQRARRAHKRMGLGDRF